MSVAIRCGLSIVLAAAAPLFVAGPALAQMVPLTDHREIHASAAQLGSSSQGDLAPSGPFASFEDYVAPSVETKGGECHAFAFQSSQFYPAGIYASGASNGGWSGEAVGSYETHVLTNFRFRVDNCTTYELDATMSPGDASEDGVKEGHISLASDLGPTFINVIDGHESLSGRLAPGVYRMEGRSRVASQAVHQDGPTYAIIWTCSVCPSSLIASHPTDATVAPGGSTSFTVVPTVAAKAQDAAGTFPTYQWRRNLVPVTDGGHFAGATTSMLTITNASAADTGYYDVVLTENSIVEPSSLARLSLSSSVGVEAGTHATLVLFAVGTATPNPSHGPVTFHYTARRAVHATATVYDAAGRSVRPLASRVLSGPGTFSWDGLDTSGEPAAPGLYFLRVVADGESHVRRFARIQ